MAPSTRDEDIRDTQEESNRALEPRGPSDQSGKLSMWEQVTNNKLLAVLLGAAILGLYVDHDHLTALNQRVAALEVASAKADTTMTGSKESLIRIEVQMQQLATSLNELKVDLKTKTK